MTIGSIDEINMLLDSSANKVSHADLPKLQFGFVEGIEGSPGLILWSECGQGSNTKSGPDDIYRLDLTRSTTKSHIGGGAVTEDFCTFPLER